jgi:hypothetical protein
VKQEPLPLWESRRRILVGCSPSPRRARHMAWWETAHLEVEARLFMLLSSTATTTSAISSSSPHPSSPSSMLRPDIFLRLLNSKCKVGDTFLGTAVQGHVPERDGGGVESSCVARVGSGDVWPRSRIGSGYARTRSKTKLDKRPRV